MSPEIYGLLGVFTLVILIFARMWIGLAMLFVGVWGLVLIEGFKPALGVLTNVPYTAVAQYSLSSLPLFLFMGVVLSQTGIGTDLYNTTYKLIGKFRGGLAMATVTACAGFSAISGSSTATAAAMGHIALPEMKKYNYDDRLAAGCTAAGGTLGILIPPSIGFIIYGILTEVSIGKLFIAGIIPGILQALFYIATIIVICSINPKLGPAGPRFKFKEQLYSLKSVFPVLILFVIVIGGIYGGLFTPTEAGAIGAFGALVITLLYRRLNFNNFYSSIMEASNITAMIILLVVGAFVFSHFIAISGLPNFISNFVTEINLPKFYILLFIVMLYLVLGIFLDIMSSIILTIPIFFPIISSLGVNPIWYGVIMVRVMEVGMITPPVGMNIFVLNGLTQIHISDIYRGVIPFIIADILHIILLLLVPSISLFLPNLMS